MDNNYRILKLRNGESLIAGLGDITTKNTIILERPMQFKTMTVIDDKTLNSKDFLIIRTWAEYSSDRNVEIPNDSILAILKPDDKLISVYDFEKNKADNPETPVNMFIPFVMQPEDVPQSNNNLQNLNIQLQLPPDASQQFLEMLGVEFADMEDMDDDFDDEDMEDMDEEEMDMFTAPPPPQKEKPSAKKDSKRPTWGNDLGDWSPDPNDYLK